MTARPLSGIRVIEFEGLGPAPTCAMLLADFGAEVLRIARPGYALFEDPVTSRGKGLLALDMKSDAGLACVRDAVALADVVIEPFRPGVMERYGLGPDSMCAAHPSLIYLRMTGWGQDGPLAARAGHDINYIALSGALEGIGRPGEVPCPPLNLIGDMGGGAAMAAFAVCAALIERQRSGLGQVIDAAILDGTNALMGMFRGLALPVDRHNSVLGGAQPSYNCYACADGRHVAVGALEQPFWDILIDTLGLNSRFKDRVATAAQLATVLADAFALRTRDDWAAIFEPLDACVTPVLSLAEATTHHHALERGLFTERDGIIHPMPAPRFSRTPARIEPSMDGKDMLAAWREG